MAWMNVDGLYVKFGSEEQAVAKGGEYRMSFDNLHEYAFTIDYRDVLSATQTVLGSVAFAGQTAGAFGVIIPKGLRIQDVETFVETAFTSSGTIASSTMQIGLANKSDRSTVLSATAITTAAATGTALGLATVGTTTRIIVGSTGAGAFLGTTVATEGVIIASNSAHATNPYTAGKLIVKVRGYYP
jgi:hypothetical protein